MSPGQNSDLKSVLARHGAFEPAQAVDVVRRVAVAIEQVYAQQGAQQGVHRDITPSTIWLGGDGTAYLSDTAAGTPSTDRTRTLVINSEATYLADIQALTAVLYECLTGFPAVTDPGTPVPPPSQRNAAVPAGFDDVIARGLADKPGDGFRSTAELLTAAQGALPVPTPSTQPTSVDAPLTRPSQDTTRAIQLPPAPPSPPAQTPAPNTTEIRPSIPAPQNPDYGRSPTISYPHSRPIPLPAMPPGPGQHRRRRWLAPALAAIVIVGVVVAGAIAIPRLVHSSSSGAASTTSAGAKSGPRTYKAEPTTLPFPGLDKLKSVAVDGAGNVYVLAAFVSTADEGLFGRGDYHVFKLAPGATTATKMDIAGVDIRNATDLAVDPGGTLYVSDRKAVWQLQPGATNPIRLPFRGFVSIEAIAIDSAGNAYAAGPITMEGNKLGYGVKKLVPGDTKPTDLTFPDLYLPHGIAVDKAGNIYVCASVKGGDHGQVLKLAAGAASPLPLTIPEAREPIHAAVDSAGNLFVSDDLSKGLFQIPAGTTTSIRVPMSTRTRAVAVDGSGNLYVTTLATKDKNDKIVKPGEVLKAVPDR